MALAAVAPTPGERLAAARARRRFERSVVAVGLVAVLVVAVALGLGAGAVAVPPAVVGQALLAKAGLIDAAGLDPVAVLVVQDLRLPRVLTGLLIGAVLALAGAAMQGLFRNPLAEPGLVGVSSGAALGAALVIVVGEAWLQGLNEPWRGLALPLAAFLGALGATVLVFRLATFTGQTAVALLLLAGIAVNAIVGAVLGFAAFWSTDQQLRDLTFWTLGSLAAVDPRGMAPALAAMLLALLVLPRFALVLDALALGEREVRQLGLDVEVAKRWLVLLVALGVGAAVATAGIVGFVGLVVPHLVRRMVGAAHGWLLPSSAVLGAALLLIADVAARLVVSPAELPIGILTAALGGPFFLILLLVQRRRFAL